MLTLASANMEELLESKFTRSRGWIPSEYLGYGTSFNHFHQGGGLNIRAFSGYLAPEIIDGQMYMLNTGIGGTSVSAELELDRLVKFKPKFLKGSVKLDVYLFGDAGVIYSNLAETSTPYSLRADAGAGIALNIVKWGKRNLIQPFTIRLDAPFVVNKIPAGETQYIAQRWVFGIGRSF